MKVAVGFLKSSTVLVAALVLVPAATFAQHYKQINLVTDLNSGAMFTNDNNLKNPWGLTRSVTGPWWISDNNAGVSTLYDGTGAARSRVVKIRLLLGSSSMAVLTLISAREIRRPRRRSSLLRKMARSRRGPAALLRLSRSTIRRFQPRLREQCTRE